MPQAEQTLGAPWSQSSKKCWSDSLNISRLRFTIVFDGECLVTFAYDTLRDRIKWSENPVYADGANESVAENGKAFLHVGMQSPCSESHNGSCLRCYDRQVV